MAHSDQFADLDAVVAASVFDVYDQALVPLVFQAYADDVARRCADVGGPVLEVAAGTGALTRALADTLPESVAITATDIVPGMLDRARHVGTSRPVAWEQADALALPYDDASFDLVVCGFGAMFFDPPSTAFAEMHRILRPGGRAVITVWDGLDDNEFAAAVDDTVQQHFADAPPRFLAAKPYSYHDRATIQGDLAAGGFDAPDVERVPLTSSAPSPLAVAAAFCAGTPLRDQIEGRGSDELAEAIAVVTDAVRRRFGPVPEGRMSAQVVSAVR